MATKVYGISGKTTVEISIPVGKALIPLSFEHGNLNRKNYRPATFSTSSKALQDMIEGSPLFGKLITLYKVFGETEEVKRKPAAPKAQVISEPQVFEDVITYEQAVVTLKKLGAKATSLRSPDNIKKFMASNNVSFPNYNFD